MAKEQVVKLPRGQEMSEEELLGVLAAHEQAAMGSSTAAGMTIAPNSPSNMTTLELDNYNALNYYFGRPLGNELPDRSQIVVPELRDTIEWIMPQLMRMFASTDRICRFEPEGDQDEDLAEQQTDACNYIFMQLNPGWMTLHDFFKDALLLRNGYIKVQWEEQRKVSLERYTGLSEEALQQLHDEAEENDEEIEVIGQEEREQITMVPAAQPPAMPPQAAGAPGAPPFPAAEPQPAAPAQAMIPQVSTVFDVQIRRVTNEGMAVVRAVPREDVLVSPRTRAGLDDSVYYCHKDQRTRSDLCADGYDEDIVYEAQPGPPKWTNLDDLARNALLDQTTQDESVDPATVEIEIRECTVRVDFDGDGIAELRRVVVIGEHVVDNEEIEEGPLASGTMMRMAHRHLGISLYEILKDLMEIKTQLTRQMLDNVYLANNTRTAVDQDNVNFDDLSLNRAGGIVRTKGSPQTLIQQLETPNVVSDVMEAIEYTDGMRQWRTGVGVDTMVPDPDALQDVTKGNYQALLSKSDGKIEMMARLLAEGLKDAFRKVNDVMVRHQDKPMMMKLRGKWVQIDPSEWRTRTHLSVNVGLGSGNKEEQRANLMMLQSAMVQGRAIGIVGPKQAYNAAKKFAETLGFTQPDEFFVDPDSPGGKQLQQQMAAAAANSPQVMAIHAKAQTEAAANAAEGQRENTRIAIQAKSDNERMQLQAHLDDVKAQRDSMLKLQEIRADANTKRSIASLNFIIGIVEAALKAQAQPQQIETDVSAAADAERRFQ